MEYLDLLTNHYVLNVGIVGIAIYVGFIVKNFINIFFVATFALAVYCLVFIFESESFLFHFFFAAYTVFMGFATLGYVAKRFKDWILVVS